MSKVSTVVSRVVMTTLLIASFAALAWADAVGLGGLPPAWWLLPVLIMFAVGGVNECVHLFAARGLLLPSWTLRGGAVAMFMAVALGTQAFVAESEAAAPVASMSWALLAYAVAIGCLVVLEIVGYRPQGRSLDRLAASSFILTFLGMPMAFMTSLRLICLENIGPEQTGFGHLGIVPLVALVATVKAGDIAAYIVGSLLGTRKMAPVLSPGKTWEGAVASVAGSAAAAWLVLEGLGQPLPFQPWGGWAVFGIVVGIAGMVGDLTESLIKREAGVKDSGHSLGGMGGMLDLVDSLLVAAPVAWALWVAGSAANGRFPG